MKVRKPQFNLRVFLEFPDKFRQNEGMNRAMRFVLITLCCAASGGRALAAPGHVFEINPNTKDIRTQAVKRTIQKQNRGQAKLSVMPGLSIETIAHNLGEVIDLTRAPSGDLFALDKHKARIWHLPDRGRDGRLDGRIALPFTFDRPSGLVAAKDDTLFVVDAQAIWHIDLATQTKTEFVNLTRAHIQPDTRTPLAVHPVTGVIYIGVNHDAQTSQLITIDPSTRRATQAYTSQGHLTAITITERGEVFAAIGDQLVKPGSGTIDSLETGTEIGALILPDEDTPENWPTLLKDHIIAVQTSPYLMPEGTSGGLNLVALSTRLGRPDGQFRIIADGFLTARGTNAWGRPGAAIMDKRGLFFVDMWQGTLWRLFPAPRPAPKTQREITSRVDTTPQNPAPLRSNTEASTLGSQMIGSQITGSSLTRGSQLDVGSIQVKDFDARKAAEEKAKREHRKDRSKN